MKQTGGKRGIKAALGVLTSAFLLFLAVQTTSAAPAAPSLAKPHPFALATDSNAFSQVAVKSINMNLDGSAPAGVDMKLAHVAQNNATNIKAPTPGASYSYSIGAYTTTGYWLQMGYIVLGSDGDGLARWFVQVLKPDGSTLEWKLSRAGEANPPPACSACSGGSTDGYPFAFTTTARGEWTFWFDGITKDRVRLTQSDVSLDPSRGIYFIAEVTAPKTVSELMGPRLALRTLSLWSSKSNSWAEAAHADAAYATNSGSSACQQYGLRPTATYPAGNYVGIAHSVEAGSGVPCWSGSVW